MKSENQFVMGIYAIVAEGHARGRSVLRHDFSLYSEYLTGSRKFLNLKVETTKSLNLGIINEKILISFFYADRHRAMY